MLRNKLLRGTFLICLLTFLYVGAMKADSDSFVRASSVGDTSVTVWLELLSSKNYDACDEMVSDSERLYTYATVFQFKDREYYTTTLNRLVDCISAIQVKSNGDGVFGLTVYYTPYEKLSELRMDRGTLSDIKTAYMHAEIGDAEFKDGLNQVYYEIFRDNCFKVGADVEELELSLSEDSDGKVHGTVEFIDALLKGSNIEYNLTQYECGVQYLVKENLEK